MVNNEYYAMDLNMLIAQLCGNIFLKFDTIYPKYHNCIQKDGMIFKRRKFIYGEQKWTQFAVCCSFGIDKGIFNAQIKCVSPKNDSIGITSSLSMCSEENKWFGYYDDGNTYCLNCTGDIYATSGTQNIDEVKQAKQDNIVAGDIIGISVDCNKWILTFERNNIKIGKSVKIVENLTYYIFIGSSFYGTEYQLIL